MDNNNVIAYEVVKQIVEKNDLSSVKSIVELKKSYSIETKEAEKMVWSVLNDMKPQKNKFIVNHDPFGKESTSEKTVSFKQQYKENKKSGIVSCPKCGSESITTTNKKISVGKGVAGAAVGSIINPVGTVVGAAVGATHSKKIYNVCMNCGHKWKP